MTSVASLSLPTTLRGRESELEILGARLRKYAETGVGGALLIRGVKGAGKSALLDKVADLATQEIRARVLRGTGTLDCTSFASLLLARLSLSSEASAVERETKLRALLSQTFEDRRVEELVALMGVRLGIPIARPDAKEAYALGNTTTIETEVAIWRRFFGAELSADRTRPLVLILDNLGASPPAERIDRKSTRLNSSHVD